MSMTGNLRKYLRERKDSNGQLRHEHNYSFVQCMKQVSSGLAYLHSEKIVHRNLKPENILKSMDNQWKITYLGLAKRLVDPYNSICGTMVYWATEQRPDPQNRWAVREV